MNSLKSIKTLKLIFAMVAFGLSLLITVGVSHAESILPFFKKKTKHIPPPPKLSEVQIRNYAYTPPATRITSATPAEVLGYGQIDDTQDRDIAKAKINHSLINSQSSAIEELLEQEEALQIRIDREMVERNDAKNADMNANTDTTNNSIIDNNIDNKEHALPAEQAIYQLSNNKKVKTNIPLQVVVTDEISTKFEIQSLEKKALTHLDEELPIKLHLPKIKPLKKSDPKQTLIANARKNSKLANKAKAKVHSNVKQSVKTSIKTSIKKNAKVKSQQIVDDSIPAFGVLMDIGIQQLKAKQLDKAEENFVKAQRIVPRSPAVYFYLGQVALKKQKAKRAENFARRGLSLSDDASRNKDFWQMILQSAQMANDKPTILEAKKALQSL